MKRILTCILIIGLMLGLAGCVDEKNKKTIDGTPQATDNAPQTTEKVPQTTDKKVQKNIEYDIVAQGDMSNYSEKGPQLYVTTNEKEFIGLNLDTDPKFNISDIDFQTDLIIVMLLGEKPNSGYTLDIKEIVQTDGSVDIFSNVKEPVGGNDVMSNPYIIIKIKRSEITDNSTTFRFFLNDTKVAGKTVII